jgi:hypothetical protein
MRCLCGIARLKQIASPFYNQPISGFSGMGKCYTSSMHNRHVIFRIHAIQRMFERHISEKNVQQVLQSGKMIEDYSDDMHLPGGLLLGKHGNRPLHVVMAENAPDNELVVITVYEPNPFQWKADFKSRKL